MATDKNIIISLVLHTMRIIQHIIQNMEEVEIKNIQHKLHKSMKLLNHCPVLYILMQKAVILNTCGIVRKFLATVNRKCLVSETVTHLRTSYTAVKYR
jgi:hypothetical protein